MDASHQVKLAPGTVWTLVVGLAYPLWLYAVLDTFVRLGWHGRNMPGLLVLFGVTAVSCAVAWLVVRPAHIRWFRWPWWTYALLAAGWMARAFLLLDTLPWGEVLAYMAFFTVVVGLQEEFVFRGCLEEGLSEFGPLAAAVVAGLFFGLSHAPSAILQGDSPAGAVLTWLGAGVLYQLIMRWLRDKGGLALPVLVHGLLDFLGAR